jgi:hypothetical protein
MSTVYEVRFPEIPWREPVKVLLVDREQRSQLGPRWGCRLCIAEHGLRGSEVKGLWSNAEEVVRHIETHHPDRPGGRPPGATGL